MRIWPNIWLGPNFGLLIAYFLLFCYTRSPSVIRTLPHLGSCCVQGLFGCQPFLQLIKVPQMTPLYPHSGRTPNPRIPHPWKPHHLYPSAKPHCQQSQQNVWANKHHPQQQSMPALTVLSRMSQPQPVALPLPMVMVTVMMKALRFLPAVLPLIHQAGGLKQQDLQVTDREWLGRLMVSKLGQLLLRKSRRLDLRSGLTYGTRQSS